MADTVVPDLEGIRRVWHGYAGCDPRDPETMRKLLSDLVHDELVSGFPLPGSGRTMARFEALALLGRLDLTMARLAEAHADALAILAELGAAAATAGEVWGVWAAEPPTAVVTATREGDTWALNGRKAWCSGAGICTHALVTGQACDGPRLFAVDLAQPGVRPGESAWATTALAGSDTRDVEFVDATCVAVGDIGEYVDRPGFWHGAAGVAAVWYGGAVAVADAVRKAALRGKLDDLGLVHFAGVDVALTAARATLEDAARSFDVDPDDRGDRAAVIARRVRAVVEATVDTVVERAGRALGPAPLAMDPVHTRRVADLQLYVRQSHADWDLVDLGHRLLDIGVTW